MSDVIPVSSPELYAAYKAWRDQDVNDGSDRAWRKRCIGLCFWVMGYGDSCELQNGLEIQFRSADFDVKFPFDEGEYYRARFREETQYLNPLRIKWVNDRIADYEKEHGL